MHGTAGRIAVPGAVVTDAAVTGAAVPAQQCRAQK